jgi:hypothetical protein
MASMVVVGLNLEIHLQKERSMQGGIINIKFCISLQVSDFSVLVNPFFNSCQRKVSSRAAFWQERVSNQSIVLRTGNKIYGC